MNKTLTTVLSVLTAAAAQAGATATAAVLPDPIQPGTSDAVANLRGLDRQSQPLSENTRPDWANQPIDGLDDGYTNVRVFGRDQSGKDRDAQYGH